MKDLSSAQTEQRVLDDGRLQLRVRHQVLRGVTPEMLVWWFSSMDGEMMVGVVRPHVFPDGKARAWLRHSVEEMGNLELFLPDLYASGSAHE